MGLFVKEFSCKVNKNKIKELHGQCDQVWANLEIGGMGLHEDIVLDLD